MIGRNITLRITYFRRVAIVAICTSLSNFAFADEVSSSPLRLLSFQVGAMATFQGGGSSWSGGVRYNPRYEISPDWSLGASIDLSPQVLDTTTRFIALSYLANGSYRIDETWSVQASVGAQTWTCSDCGTALTLGPMVRYSVSPTWANWVKNVWVQYLAVLHQPTVHQIVLGVGIEF